MHQQEIDAIVQAVLEELGRGSASRGTAPLGTAPPTTAPRAPVPAEPAPAAGRAIIIDLPDLTTPEMRARTWLEAPARPDVLRALKATTPARIGVGRAGPRYRNEPLFLFLADHAVTQDALFREIDPAFLERFNLFQVQTQVRNRQEYLLRPDLGRLLAEDARRTIAERCVQKPDVQVYAADGLSVAAIEANLADILPVLREGFARAKLTMGTPFYVQYGRVGLMNDVNRIVDAQVVIALIGERPGLGRAESMSAYMGYRPKPDSTDADRDVVCNIYAGGTNPVEAGAYVVELATKMIQHQASGVRLKVKLAGESSR